jgi:predicted TIM-barrel fold metal-dependent hydrolase
MTHPLNISDFPVFDSHFHIIDPRFPLIENAAYLPSQFTTRDYMSCLSEYKLTGGAVISGSFQGFDQSYLLETLRDLGPNYVGVTQLPASATDQQINDLKEQGVRAIRFNLRRGGSETIDQIQSVAYRVYAIANWHIELYVDAHELDNLSELLCELPAVSIDHLGLSKAGLPVLKKLVENGVYVKATGFSRLDFDPVQAIKDLNDINPDAVMFGTDLPSTRAPVPYSNLDLSLLLEAFDAKTIRKLLETNAREFYKLQ